MIPRFSDTIHVFFSYHLCIRQDEASVIWVKDGVLFLERSVDSCFLSLNLGRVVVDFVVQFGQERGCGYGKPSPAAELEGSKVSAPVCSAEHGVGIALEFFKRYASEGRNLGSHVSNRFNQ